MDRISTHKLLSTAVIFKFINYNYDLVAINMNLFTLSVITHIITCQNAVVIDQNWGNSH
jgi:hypothetical protein